MAFPEKSALAVAAALTIAYGAYFAVVLSWTATSPLDEIVYQPLMIVATVVLAGLTAGTHVLLALFDPRGANETDERDRTIAGRSGQVGGWVLAIAVFTGLVLAMAEVHHLVIANTLLGLWVLAEIVEAGVTVVLYRRGVAA